MSDNGFEPIKIWIPDSLLNVLYRDAELFENFLNKDGKVVIGRFLNALVPGYFEQYKSELAKQEAGLRSILGSYIPRKADLNAVIDKIIRGHVPERDDDKSQKVLKRFRPHGKAADIHAEIISNIYNMGSFISEYYLNMLYSYSHKPMYQRELYIFNDEAEKIKKALASRKRQELIIINGDNPRSVHTVLPYKLVHGADEQFNYLIGQEKNGRKLMTCSYRLRRIRISGSQPTEMMLDRQIKCYLDEMIYYDPLYVINEHEETCVEFTEEGLKDFRRIYLNRPKMEPIEGSVTKYRTYCSRDQLLNYFKRFNPGEVIILHPKKLKENLIHFHKRHLEEMK